MVKPIEMTLIMPPMRIFVDVQANLSTSKPTSPA